MAFQGLFAQETIDVLFIGNSFTYYPDPGVDQLFEGFAAADGYSVYTERIASAGASVEDNHLDDPAVEAALQSREWDYVVLQDNLGYYAYGYIGQTTGDANVALINMIHQYNSCVTVVLFAGWGPVGGVSSTDDTQSCIENIYTAMKSLNDATGELMAPIAKAWNASLTQYPSLNLYYSDDTHSNETGSYLATAVIYSTVFRENPVDNTYEGLVGNSTTAANMRQLAWDAVSNPTYQSECNFPAHTADISFANPTLTCTGSWSAYQWVNNNTNYISGATNSTYNISEDGDYYVVVTDADGCKTRSFEIPCTYSANGDPTAQFSGTPTTIHEGEAVTFTDLSGDGGYAISNWEWIFTGGTPSSYTGQTPPAITYNTAGTYEVSLTVTNSQSSDTETKTGYITVLEMGDAFSLDFEACTDYSEDFTPWSTLCVDGKATYSSSDFDFPGEGTAFGFMAFNPVDAAISTPIANTHAGDRCGISSCPSDQSQTNHWLISDKVNLGTGAQFKFWVLTLKDTWGLEDYNVLVSTTNNDPGSFTAIASGETAPASWTQKSYDLSSYVGQDIYVAIQHTSIDKFMLWIDDMEILGGTTSTEIVENKNIDVYPNPTKNIVNITNSDNSIINIIDINGKTVLSENINSDMFSIDISFLNQGTYFVRIISEETVTIKKLIKE